MGGLGLIIISNLNLSWVKLMLGWVMTIMEAARYQLSDISLALKVFSAAERNQH